MCVRLVQNGKHVRSSVLRAAVSIIRYTDFQYVQQYNRIKLLVITTEHTAGIQKDTMLYKYLKASALPL